MKWMLWCVMLVSIGLGAEENFVMLEGSTGEVIKQVGLDLEKRVSPCSSFKMVLSLMGYDAGILVDEETPEWPFQEGYDDFLPAWREAQTPLSWMQHSCVWYSEVLSLKLGQEKMQGYLDGMQYGNRDILGEEKPAWINSSLAISPREQAEVIRKMLLGELPVSADAVKWTKQLVFKEELADGWKLFGKTGWSGSRALQHGWFVGWIEKGEQFFPFAYLIEGETIDLSTRIPRAKELLKSG